MSCPQCGTAREEHFRFCSSCGATLGSTPTPRVQKFRSPDDMERHVKVLAWLLIGSAVLTGMLSTMVLIAGRFLDALPLPFSSEFGLAVGSLVTSIVSIVGLSMVIVSAVTAVAGVGLLYYQTWGRVMAIVAASLMLLKFPIGTAIGIYAFWVLLSADGREHFRTRSIEAM
jgi:hypothetical protein